MSVIVYKDQLTPQAKAEAVKDLTYTYRPYIPGKRFQKKAEYLYNFIEMRDYMHIPMHYASQLELKDGTTPRRARKPETDVGKFTGTLKEEKDQPALVAELQERLQRAGTALMHLPTGKGKTTMSVYLSCELKRVTLVLCERKQVANWKKTFETRTTTTPYVLSTKRNPKYIETNVRKREYPRAFLLEVVKHFGGWTKLGLKASDYKDNAVLKKYLEDEKYLSRYVEMRMQNPVSKYVLVKEPKQLGVIIATPEILKKTPQWFRDSIGTFIVDEVHSFYTAQRARIMCAIAPEYFIACSATPFKSKKKFSGLILDIVGQNQVVFRQTDAHYLLIKYNTGIRILPGVDSKEDGYWDSLLCAQSDDMVRNQMVVDIVKQYPKRRFIVFTWRNESHTPKICQLLDEAGISNSLYCGSDTEYEQAQVVVTTVSKGCEGFDQDAVCRGFDPTDPDSRISMLISLITMRSKETFRQMRGRVVGRATNPGIIMFSDLNRVCDSHCKQMLISAKKDPNCTALEMEHGGPLPESWEIIETKE